MLHLDEYMFMFAWLSVVITILSLTVIGRVEAQQAVLKYIDFDLYCFYSLAATKGDLVLPAALIRFRTHSTRVFTQLSHQKIHI